MAVAMTAVLVQPCFATSMAEITDFIDNPFDLPQMTLEVKARKSGTEDGYDSSLALTEEGDAKVDYQATLDMGIVRGLFNEGFMTILIPKDPQLQSEFDSAKISTTVDVVVDYPSSAKITADLAQKDVGKLDAGIIFSEKSRKVTGNKVTITYENREGLTAKELTANVNTYLQDISFTLNDTVSYEDEGTHTVTVTMSGHTKVEFDTKVQVINYYGGSSHITNYSKKIVEHILEIVPLKPATCTEDGQTESVKCATHGGYDCQVNGIVKPVKLNKLEHEFGGVTMKVEIPEVKATCATQGVKKHSMCILCKQDFIGESEVSFNELIIPISTTHTGLKKVEGQNPTCVKDGLTDGEKCETCGKITKAQTVIKALGHDVVEVPGIAPTCISIGISNGQKCNRCALVLKSQEIVPALGHDMSEWKTNTEATETSEGEQERSCKREGCTYKEVVKIPKLQHIHEVEPKMDVVTKEATCTEPGKKQQYCSCGLKYGDEVEIPAKGHAEELSHIDAIEATCSENGTIEHYKCPDCGEMFRDENAQYKIVSAVIPKDKNNHAGGEVIIRGIAATCTTEGLTEGKKCKKCNTVTKSQEITEKLWDDVVMQIPETPASCTGNGVAEHYHCMHCNKDFNMKKEEVVDNKELVIVAKGHSYGDWEEISKGDKKYRQRKCSVCDAIDEVEKNEAVHEHNEARWEIIKDSTFTETGLKRKVYSCCGVVIEDNVEIPKKEHQLEFVPPVPATCYSEGTAAYWRCKNCNKKFSTQDMTDEIDAPTTLEKLVHSWSSEILENYNVCKHCGEKVKLITPDRAYVKIDSHGSIIDEKDRIRKDVINSISGDNNKVTVDIEAEIIVEPREEVSKEIDDDIRAQVSSEQTQSEKVAYDITVEKITKYSDKSSEDREFVTETGDLMTITMKIPESMQDKKDFLVHRMHNNQTEILGTTENADGEYIDIDKTTWEVKLKVKKFSEYVLVGYSEIVNDDPVTPQPPGGISSSGGSGTKIYTVKFNTNGGTAVKNVTVKHGNTISAPQTVRDGYKLEGWYTDYELTKPYDFSTVVTYNMTLYAKWVEIKGTGDIIITDKCDGTIADNCPGLKFTDIDSTMWYHEGVDFVLTNGMMKGVAEGEFAPNLSVTRGMLVTVLYRAESEPTAPTEVSFKDLIDGEYYVDAVKWAAENGIVLGYSDTEYAPNDTITREQIAAIIHRYAKFKGFDVSVGETTNIHSYTDYDSISEYAIPSLQYAVGTGLMKGRTDTTINPTEKTTRAEIATILYRFYRANVKTESVEDTTK